MLTDAKGDEVLRFVDLAVADESGRVELARVVPVLGAGVHAPAVHEDPRVLRDVVSEQLRTRREKTTFKGRV